MAKLMKHKKIRIFFLLYLCVSLTVGFIVTVLYYNRIRDDRSSYLSSLESNTENIMNYFNQSFVAAVSNCNTIFSSKWYNHYRNIAQLYKDEFHAVRKREIIDELSLRVATLHYVSDILIIIPPLPGEVICKKGWFSFEDYKLISGMVDIEISDTKHNIPIVHPASDSIGVITLKDINLRMAQAVIAILIDRQSVATTMQDILPENSVYARAELCGLTFFETGELSDDLVINTTSIDMPQFSITIGSLSYSNSLLKAHITSYMLVMIIVLLAGAIISGVITIALLKPLARIITMFGGNFHKTHDPYCFISDYMADYTRKNLQLSREKEHLNQSLERFHSIMRDEIFFGMLTNPHFDFHDEFTSTSIPWINEGYPYILALLEPKYRGTTELPNVSLLEELSTSTIYFCTFSILNNDMCILFWFKDSNLAKKQRAFIRERLDQIANGTYLFSISEVLQDPKAMVERYLKHKSEISIQKKDQLDLPLFFQIELVSKLQECNPQECVAFLNQSHESVHPGALMELLSRVAMKYDTDLSQMINQFDQYVKSNQKDKQWKVVLSSADKICKSIQRVKHVSANESAEIICHYIEENYCDPDLSMKKLADHFFMHRTLISKILKAELGITFSDYLLKLRIKKAMELLKSTNINIFEIGKKVGYVNYITFKRAFSRYKGVSPKEFRTTFADE